MCSVFLGGWRRSSGPRQGFWPCPGDSGVWKNLPWRVFCMSWIGFVIHDSRRARLPCRGKHEHIHADDWRPHGSTIVLASISLLAIFAVGCRSSKTAEDPAATFQQIRGDFLHGNLDVAQVEADQALHRFSDKDSNW